MTTARPFKTAGLVILGLACATALGACGRRGPLEAPPTAQGQQSRGAQQVAGGADEALPQGSTFAGSPTFRPVRETDVARDESQVDAPPVPENPIARIETPQGSNAVTAAQGGLRSQQRGPRRSPPPNVPFILDPLL